MDGRSWDERTFPDWILDAAQNFPYLSYVNDCKQLETEVNDDCEVADFSRNSLLANLVSLFAFRSYDPFDAGMVFLGCIAFSLIVFLSLNMSDAWVPKHDIFRFTITGFVVGLQATRVAPLLYLELSLQMNDLVDGIVHPMTLYAALLYFTVFFCTFMGFLSTLVMNIILPLASGIENPFGTQSADAMGWDGTSLKKIGDAHLVSSAVILNVLLSNVFGLMGLFLLSAFGDFKNNLPLAKSTNISFYLTAVLATGSLFGGTVYSEKESTDLLVGLLYLSPTYWYTKGSLLAWFAGHEYKARAASKCDTTGGDGPSLFSSDMCGDVLFEQLYGSANINQGLPLVVLFIISLCLALVGALAFWFNLKHRHSTYQREVIARLQEDRDDLVSQRETLDSQLLKTDGEENALLSIKREIAEVRKLRAQAIGHLGSKWDNEMNIGHAWKFGSSGNNRIVPWSNENNDVGVEQKRVSVDSTAVVESATEGPTVLRPGSEAVTAA
jgi:hypothetical protein